MSLRDVRPFVVTGPHAAKQPPLDASDDAARGTGEAIERVLTMRSQVLLWECISSAHADLLAWFRSATDSLASDRYRESHFLSIDMAHPGGGAGVAGAFRVANEHAKFVQLPASGEWTAQKVCSRFAHAEVAPCHLAFPAFVLACCCSVAAGWLADRWRRAFQGRIPSAARERTSPRRVPAVACR